MRLKNLRNMPTKDTEGKGSKSFGIILGSAMVLLLAALGLIPTSASADSNETAVGGANATRQAAITGGAHTCVLMIATGGVKCWGANTDGQIGDNTTDNKTAPTDVSGLTSGVIAVTAGSGHTCALLDTGAVKCWGNNDRGQIGDNTTVDKLVPTDVSGLTSGVTAISAGTNHTCALLATGGVKCWGFNGSARLGDGTATDRSVPTDVSGLTSGVTAISAGDLHSCALLATGGVKCWGSNVAGQLGDNSTNGRLVPTDVSGLSSGVTAISAGGYNTCALLATGAVKCWGDNFNGSVGDNTNANKLVPTDVSGLSSGVTAISTGLAHTCALLSTGGVKCWGGNTSGQVGDNTTANKLVPTDVSGLSSGVTAITTGDYHSCALLTTDGIKCWGRNSSGQLGDSTTADRLVPTDVRTSGVFSGAGPTTTTTTTTTIAPTTTAAPTTSAAPTTTAVSTTTSQPKVTKKKGTLPETGRQADSLLAASALMVIAGVIIASRRRLSRG